MFYFISTHFLFYSKMTKTLDIVKRSHIASIFISSKVIYYVIFFSLQSNWEAVNSLVRYIKIETTSESLLKSQP